MFNYSTGNLLPSVCLCVCVYYIFALHVQLLQLECYHFDGFYVIIASLLLRRECCSFSNGEYVKTGLSELEKWCVEATDEVSTIQPSETFQILSSFISSPESFMYSMLAQLGRN